MYAKLFERGVCVCVCVQSAYDGGASPLQVRYTESGPLLAHVIVNNTRFC